MRCHAVLAELTCSVNHDGFTVGRNQVLIFQHFQNTAYCLTRTSDDLTNLLIAYQYQWNRFHSLLHLYYKSSAEFKSALKKGTFYTDLQCSYWTL